MKNQGLRLICASAGLLLCLAAPVSAQLRVGAGRVDITPDPAMLPAPFTSIHDPLFTRAILVENGKYLGAADESGRGKYPVDLY